MDRKNSIEYTLLSRCYNPGEEDKVIEILEQRYAADGNYKNYLVLKPTDNATVVERKTLQEMATNFLHDSRSARIRNGMKENKYSASKTRNEFKLFIKETQKAQETLLRKISKLPKGTDPSQFPEFKKVLKFEEFIGLNALWEEYARDVLYPAGETGEDPLNLMTKITSMDLIGSFLTVVKSNNFNMVGLCGIVAWESQHNFLVVVPRLDGWKGEVNGLGDAEPSKKSFSWRETIGGMRIINKKNTLFQLKVPTKDASQYIPFTIVGNRFQIKSHERASRKFKAHNVRDL
ncbi:RNase MRP and nuclear RNase P subunit [Komagataella phaffii CBS 7435]|uniref:Uncharacterized protein n=2 Tax=Komagataella phaffii TaxID=460519 RepID=C4R8M6_KOMPG|nr:Hypothetical protein PAS_chr4_0690 [Komagataella phaffii GS115]AOA65282.1 GQ67_05070T0 [Komagataella phaffii]CAH2450646.1 RNase MRP and nuclear RNase P subunit [Komagataella phaffii CBS 7435]AOA69859.1 GQ68_05051T0 [Komagataella phaffii GS115]CAY71951.1 Hypothetical protein PAS_chr4_0690 [Komagataella phaffii GS115]CCA40448.1 RNase MRP and nuclear RNase P subunit [Komagataella phaffii CBS 7435]